MTEPSRYRLITADGSVVSSLTRGTFGGHRRNRVYGRLDCKAARRALSVGGSYAQQRVFFADEATARAAGYRPCAVCMPDEYKAWKARGT
jgi:methylphosphotriester-DNA--protein-cysteine methyltransferase